MATDPVAICNRALDEIGTAAIVSLGDNTTAAKACSRQYPAALEEMLAEGEWEFAKVRATLVQTANDRSDDGYAFAMPGNVAFPLRMVPVVPGQQYPERFWTPSVNGATYPYDIGGGKLYARYQGVILEYVRTDPSPAAMPPLFARALVLLLASKIVYPITKDAGRRRELQADAEIHRQRALANEANKVPAGYGNFIPEVMALDEATYPDGLVLGLASRPTGNAGVL